MSIIQKSKKSQAAMEFLMTYGWALLVVLIAIAALAFFGLLNPQRFLPEKCELGSGLTCLEFAASSTNAPAFNNPQYNLTLIFNNGMGVPVYDMFINVSVCGSSNYTHLGVNVQNAQGCIPGKSPYSNCSGGAFVATLAEGQTARAYINCTNNMLGMPGTRFKSDVIINYSTITDGQTLSHSKKGFIVVAVQ